MTMFNSILVICCTGLITCIFARSTNTQYNTEILSQENANLSEVSYKTTNNERRQETWELSYKSKSPVAVVRGFYTYTGNNGKNYEIRYVADENGFRPEILVNPDVFVAIPKTTTLPPPKTTTQLPVAAPIPSLGIGSSAIGSLSGGGLGRK